MSISSTVSKELTKIENVLIKSGLYESFSYTDKTFKETEYNPVTGTTDGSTSSIVYTFNGIPLQQRSGNLEESAYSVLMDIIVMYANVKFDMRPGLEFVYGSQVWHVSTFKLNPENSMYEITLGSK